MLRTFETKEPKDMHMLYIHQFLHRCIFALHKNPGNKSKLGGGFKYYCLFSPLPGEMKSNLTSICFKRVGSTT